MSFIIYILTPLLQSSETIIKNLLAEVVGMVVIITMMAYFGLGNLWGILYTMVGLSSSGLQCWYCWYIITKIRLYHNVMWHGRDQESGDVTWEEQESSDVTWEGPVQGSWCDVGGPVQGSWCDMRGTSPGVVMWHGRSQGSGDVTWYKLVNK